MKARPGLFREYLRHLVDIILALQDKPTRLHALFGTLGKVVSKNVYLDMQTLVDKVCASDVGWTIVRVPMLIDAPRTGKVWVGYVGKEMRPRFSRADVAELGSGH